MSNTANSDLLGVRPQYQEGDDEVEGGNDPPPAFWLAVLVALLVVVVVGLFAYLLFRSPKQVVHCAAERNTIRDVREYFAAAEYRNAVSVSGNLLTSHKYLCSGARTSLSVAWSQASYMALLGRPRPEYSNALDPARMENETTMWQSIVKRSRALHVPSIAVIPPLTVSILSGNRGSYELAVKAFRTAFTTQPPEVTVHNRNALLRYAQMLTRWGQTLVNDNADKRQGITELATAARIEFEYKLPDGRACEYLQGYHIDNCGQADTDPEDPVLAAYGTSGG